LELQHAAAAAAMQRAHMLASAAPGGPARRRAHAAGALQHDRDIAALASAHADA
jgi:hypothetical protein